ncbi:MAG: hypothetical protein Q8L94_17035 [Parvibaculum sp.]|uniref:hypothetical protein n=1 Tax=Parvibaculum sp. TaxID=2024848 RepID=UPI0027316C43|nr:hypothetical protein [Parvibaculum sp.]MDP1628823.1 hypothetical protein [Parvibaculum sp.]MDP2148218.1 hypothetical protein [Parvibaculum sp.]
MTAILGVLLALVVLTAPFVGLADLIMSWRSAEKRPARIAKYSFGATALAFVALVAVASGDSTGPTPTAEDAVEEATTLEEFAAMIEETRGAYQGTDNPVKMAAAVARRDALLAELLPDGEFSAWSGEVYGITRADNGDLGLVLDMGDDIWLDARADSSAVDGSVTQIPVDGPMAAVVAELEEGDEVEAWGRIVREMSVTESGAMDEPEYLTVFYWVAPAGAAAPSAEALTEARAAVAARLAEAAALSAEKEAACREDVRCWSERFGAKASAACGEKIEAAAVYDFRWTDGFLTSRWESISWADKDAGVVHYFGDEIEMQNAFGNWIRQQYACTYDTIKDEAGEVVVAAGRLK